MCERGGKGKGASGHRTNLEKRKKVPALICGKKCSLCAGGEIIIELTAIGGKQRRKSQGGRKGGWAKKISSRQSHFARPPHQQKKFSRKKLVYSYCFGKGEKVFREEEKIGGYFHEAIKKHRKRGLPSWQYHRGGAYNHFSRPMQRYQCVTNKGREVNLMTTVTRGGRGILLLKGDVPSLRISYSRKGERGRISKWKKKEI